jgi:hypothetical protein
METEIETCARIPTPAIDKNGNEYIICVKLGGTYQPPHFYVFKDPTSCSEWKSGYAITFQGNLLTERGMSIVDPSQDMLDAVKSKLSDMNETGEIQNWQILLMLWNYSNPKVQLTYRNMPEDLFKTIKRF